ncbi:mechanosensitive ion channel [Pedobacter sp. HMF7647]|uniref:Mechanosensitive ion channel n=1 Tax=Hufsiella arboris TaxID=2695275 RepID=A0A7K1Y895_9SPHI|nr:mechanosensitive ion channel domain-containing protein [Hufsiella arboris]MXV50805.1 mechanosensitive ion channel [Hufsiella arboris]
MQLDFLVNSTLPPFVKNLIIAAIAIVLGILIKITLHYTFKFLFKWWPNFLIQTIIKHLAGPITFFIPLLFLNASLEYMQLSKTVYLGLNKAVEIALTVNFAIVLIRILNIAEDYFYHHYDTNKDDNLRERKIRTQLQFIRKILVSLIALVTVAIVLLSFESMRKIGTGLLTGVGIGGIIIGFAAQKSLGNLLAGFQIAFTQPIRIDDVLIVEGEWGRVEEITLTYVVVNIWDQRRLILPITYFIEKPFQNWTRVSAELLGTVFLYLDYDTPIQPLREKLTELLSNHPLWDKRVNVVQVTDSKPNTIEVRFLMSARNSSQAFDLRCDVRENLLAFIRESFPDSLPKNRVLLQKE